MIRDEEQLDQARLAEQVLCRSKRHQESRAVRTATAVVHEGAHAHDRGRAPDENSQRVTRTGVETGCGVGIDVDLAGAQISQ